jgi:excisionase family DNA binding protein
MSAAKPYSVVVNPTELLNLSAAGSLLGLTIWQLRGLIASRSIPVVKVGRKFYLRRTTLLRWTERAEGLVRQ